MADEKPKFGKYQVHDLLGEGGMGRVWRGFDPDLEVPVAIKELKEQFRDQNNLERFYREAQIAAKCRHQNIVLITDLSKDPPYFVMEFLDAQELSVFTAKGKPISLDRLVYILGQVCDGLGFLHGRGIFHRDLKPANIMLLEDDSVKITDFGISKAPFGQATMTQVIMGTIPYMSPEQITTPGQIDHRVDVWALGIILYELTQRRHPFPGEGDINTIFHIVHSEPAAFSQMPPPVTEKLQALLSKAMSKDPEGRVASTAEFKKLLRGLERGIDEPEGVVFPFQAQAGTPSTSVISQEDVLKVVGGRAESVIAVIESLTDSQKKVLEGGILKRASEVAMMARSLLKEKNLAGIESVLKDLEAQRSAVLTGIAAGLEKEREAAKEQAEAGRHQKAIEGWERILAVEPDDAEAREGIEEARKSLEAAGAARQIDSLMEKGGALFASGDLEGAAGAWRKVLEVQPGHTQATTLLRDAEKGLKEQKEREDLRGKAAAALKANRPEEAVTFLDKLLALAPGDEEALAMQAEAQKTIEEATRSLHADALRVEGRRFLEAKDWDRARISWSTLLELTPDDKEAPKALREIEKGLKEKSREEGARSTLEQAEAALRESDFQKAVDLFQEASQVLPDEAAVRKGLEKAGKRLEALRQAEGDAAAREKEKDLPGALKLWEQIQALQPSHPGAGKEIDRIQGLLRRAEEAEKKRRAEEAEKKRQAEEAEKKRRAEEAEKKRRAEEAEKKRQAEEAEKKRQAEEAEKKRRAEEAERNRKAEEEARRKQEEEERRRREAEEKKKRQEADAALKEIEKAVAGVREVPREDHPLLGADLVGKAAKVLARIDEAHGKADAKGIRAQAKEIRSAADQIAARREKVLAEWAKKIQEANGGLQKGIEENQASLKTSTVKSAKDLIARAAKEAKGPAIHPLAGLVDSVKKARDGILREVQETLKSARAEVEKAKTALDGAATKNRRAVARDAQLTGKIDSLGKRAATAVREESLAKLQALVKELNEARAAVPTDMMRFLPHAIAAVGILAAAAGYLGWQWMQANTEHAYTLQVAPWGKVISIQSEAGEEMTVPAGESPFHQLSLVPGAYTVTVENPASGARESLTITIPDETGGRVELEGPDMKKGIRQLLDRDPFFEDNS